MKRIIIVLSVLLIALLCFSSCNNNVETDPTFIKLNELAQKEDNNYTLSITIEGSNGHTTKNTFTVTEEGGNLSVYKKTETINKFDIVNGTVTYPDSYITEKEDYLTSAELKYRDYTLPSFNFSSNSIESYYEAYSSLNGRIKSIEALAGYDIDATDARVKVVYNDEAISSITITYVSAEGSNVTIEYTLN